MVKVRKQHAHNKVRSRAITRRDYWVLASWEPSSSTCGVTTGGWVLRRQEVPGIVPAWDGDGCIVQLCWVHLRYAQAMVTVGAACVPRPALPLEDQGVGEGHASVWADD